MHFPKGHTAFERPGFLFQSESRIKARPANQKAIAPQTVDSAAPAIFQPHDE
jgi:hypothetical protein